jgi:hypothetical protein
MSLFIPPLPIFQLSLSHTAGDPTILWNFKQNMRSPTLRQNLLQTESKACALHPHASSATHPTLALCSSFPSRTQQTAVSSVIVPFMYPELNPWAPLSGDTMGGVLFQLA